jgi:hypothetical protein
MKNPPRPIHCSFCLEEGHHIHRCKDASVSLLNEEVEEVAAIDWKVGLDDGFLRRKLATLTTPDIKVLGYKRAVQNVNKRPISEIIQDLVVVFMDNTNTHRYVIENLNAGDIEYFAEKVYLHTLTLDQQDPLSLYDIRIRLNDDTPPIEQKNDVTDYPLTSVNNRDTELIYYVEFIQPFIETLNINSISGFMKHLHYPCCTIIATSLFILFYNYKQEE